MQTLLSDLRYAVRSLRTNPGFALVAILALALGIGANTAIFGVINAVVLRPLPFAGADRLLMITSLSKTDTTQGNASYPDFQDFRERNHTLEHIAAFHDDIWALSIPGRSASNLRVAIVSADLFPMLAARPRIGRAFRREEDENVGLPSAVILSDAAWRKHFGADGNIIGKPIRLRQELFTVIGVMPPGFNFPVKNEPFEAWTTFAFSSDLRASEGSRPFGKNRGAHFLDVIGKRKPTATVAEVQANLSAIVRALTREYPRTNKYRRVSVGPLIEQLIATLRPILLLLQGAVLCVLLVACANVANLLLSRASARGREMAIRAALGARRSRLIRQALTESVLLALIGGAAGVLLAMWGTELLVRFSPVDVPRIKEASLDAPVLIFAFALSLLTGIVFGVAPALRLAQSSPGEALKETGRGNTEGVRGSRLRGALIVGEVALALMLLSSAGLLLRSLARLHEFDPGFRGSHTLTASITLPEARYPNARINPFLDALDNRLRRVPGVRAAGDVAIVPLGGSDMTTSLELEGKPLPVEERQSTRINISSPSYFESLGVPFVSGRDFNARDTEQSPQVVIVNEAFARQFFPGQSAVGRRVKPGFGRGKGENPLREIVGVVRSVSQDRIGQKPLAELFIPRSQLPSNSATLVLHTVPDPHAVIPGLRAALESLDPDIPIDSLHTMDDLISDSLAKPRFESYLLALFAAVALVLTSVGLYGVIAYSVSQRTHEIGTRMALGAQRQNILGLVVRQGMLLCAIGVVLGVAGAALVSRALETQLFEIQGTDPVTLAAVAVIVFAVSLLATLVPALRAASVDPMIALRYE